MPTYEFTETDGSVYEIDGPEGATAEQIAAAVRNSLAIEKGRQEEEEARRAYEAYLTAPIATRPEEIEEPGITDQLEELIKGIPAGAANILETSALGLITPFEEETELALREGIQGFFDPIQEFVSPDKGSEDLLLRKFGEALGSYGTIGATALFGGVPAAAVLTGGAGAGEATERARVGGATEEQRGLAALYGAGVGLSELLPITRAIRLLKGGLGNDAAEGFIGAAGRIIREGGFEGLQEFAAGVGQNLIEQKIYNPEQGTFEGGAEQFGLGAGVGGFVRAVVELITPRRRTPAQKALPAPEGIAGLLPAPETGPTGGPERQLALPAPELSIAELIIKQQQSTDPDTEATLAALLAGTETGVTPESETALAAIERGDAPLNPVIEEVARLQATPEIKTTPESETALAAIERGDAPLDPVIEEAARRQTAPELEEAPEVVPEVVPKVVPESEVETAPEEVASEVAPRIITKKMLDDLLIAKQAPIRKSVTGKDFNDPDIRNKLKKFAENPKTAMMAAANVKNLLDTAAAEQTATTAGRTASGTSSVDTTQEEDIVDTAPPEAKTHFVYQRNVGKTKQIVHRGSLESSRKFIEQNAKYYDHKGKNFDIYEGKPGKVTPKDRVEGVAPQEGETDEPIGRPDIDVTGVDPDNLTDRESVRVSSRPTSPVVGSPARPDTPANVGVGDPEAGSGRADAGQRERLDTLITDVTENLNEVDTAERVKTKRTKKPAAKELTKEALELISLAEDGSKMSEVIFKSDSSRNPLTVNQISIAEDNDIEVTPKTTPKELVDALKAKITTVIPEKKPRKIKDTSIPKPVIERTKAKRTATGVSEKEEYPNRGPVRSEKEISNMEKRTPYGFMGSPVKERLRKGNYNVEEDIVTAPSPFTSQDNEIIAKLTDEGTTTRDINGISARAYLSKFDNPTTGLASAIFDDVNKTPIFKIAKGLTEQEKTEQKLKYGQTGGIHAGRALAWAEANLSSTTQAWIVKEERRIIDEQFKDLKLEANKESIVTKLNDAEAEKLQKLDEERVRVDKEEAQRRRDINRKGNKLTRELNAALAKNLKIYKEKLLQIDQVVGLDLPTHPEVSNLLRANKLKEALRVLADTSPSSRVSQIARKLEQKLGDTKVEVVENLTSKAGVSAAGLFDPETNTIKINATTGINAHTILHETTHALTSATLAKKSHVVTNKLKTLFNELKDQGALDSFYGSQNVDEFVAEAFGNPEFQQKLASINPKGSPISALQRFLNIIGNFLRNLVGMQTKPPSDSALNKADEFIEAILAPAPDSRDAGELLMSSTADGVKRVMEGFGKVQKKFSKPITSKQRKEFANKAVDFLQDSRIADVFKRFLLGTLGTKSLADVSLRNGFRDLGLKVHQIIGDQRGAIQKSDKIVHDYIKNTYMPWAVANSKAKAALDRVIYSDEYGATIYQVDPTKLESDYEGKTDDSGNDLGAIWQAQREDWKIVRESTYEGKTGVDVFNSMRKLYKDQYEKLEKVINGEIDALIQNDPDAAKRLKNEVFAKLFEAGKLDVYFPLVRQGRYKLSYAMKNPKSPREAYVVRMFDTKMERNKAEREVKADEDVVTDSVDTSDGDMQLKDYSNAPPTSFVKNTLDILNAQPNVDAEAKEAIMRLFIETLPETSFAKSLQRRKETPGYIQNSLVGLRTKAYDIGRQAVRLEYAARLRALEEEIQATTQGINKAAEEFLTTVKKGMPTSVTDKLRGIAESNGIKVTSKTTPKDIVDILEYKKFAAQSADSVMGKTKDSISASFADTKTELLRRTKFARSGAGNKGRERFYKTANQAAFVYTIGFNVSSAMVNLSQVPLFALPYMGAQFGYNNASKAIWRASKFSKLVMIPAIPKYSDGKLKGGDRDQIDDYYDVDADGNYTVKDGLKLYDDASKNAETIKELKRMAPIVKLASQRGYLGRSFLLDELGVEEGGRQAQGNTASRVLDNISSVSAFAFNAVEKYNRQTIAFANYDLILDKLNSGDRFYSETQGKYIPSNTLNNAQKEELAAEEALYQTEQLNGGMSLESAPRIAQEGLGRVAYMYKGYGMNMYYAMLKSTSRMLDTSVDPALRKQAMKEVIGIHGSALFFAGIHGVPLYGIFTMIADLFLDDEEDDADTIVRKYINEGWYKGPLNAMLGVDVASRVRLTDLLFQENRYNSDPSPEEFLGFYLGGPALSTAKRIVRGYDDLQNGYIERGIENLLPPAIANAYKASFGRYAREDAILTRRRDPIYDDITSGELVGQFFGFAPSGYTFEQERNQSLMGIQRSINERRTKLLRKLYNSYRMGDGEGYADTLKDVRKFNERYRGTKAVISPSTVLKSIRTNQRNTVKMHNGINIAPNLRALILRNSREWE